MPFDSREFQFSDTKVAILGKQLTGLRGLIYKKTQEKDYAYGAGDEPKAIQRGNKKYDGTLRLLKSDYDLLKRAAITAGYEDLTDVPGDTIIITCVYQKPGITGLSTDTCFYCEFTEVEDGMVQGDKFKEISLPFIFLRKKSI